MNEELNLAALQYEEPLLAALFKLFKTKFQAKLNEANPFAKEAGISSDAVRLPEAVGITLDLDSFTGNFPCIVLTHARWTGEWKQRGGHVNESNTIEIDYLTNVRNDISGVIEIHRVARAIKLLLMETEPKEFLQFYRKDVALNCSLKSPLEQQALMVENGNKVVRGVRIAAQFSFTEQSNPGTVNRG